MLRGIAMMLRNPAAYRNLIEDEHLTLEKLATISMMCRAVAAAPHGESLAASPPP